MSPLGELKFRLRGWVHGETHRPLEPDLGNASEGNSEWSHLRFSSPAVVLWSSVL